MLDHSGNNYVLQINKRKFYTELSGSYKIQYYLVCLTTATLFTITEKYFALKCNLPT